MLRRLPILVFSLVLLACGGGDPATTVDTASGTTAQTSSSGATSSTGAPTSTGEATSSTGTPTSAGSSTGELEDLDMQAEDFVCILGWDKVRKFRITNLLGHLDEALAVAADPSGGVYPVGTVIQLIPNEAMVKRAIGFSPENADWEFFALETSAAGAVIKARGTTEVVNGFGGNCFDCHAKAAPQWDRICEEGHGCDPLPFTPEQIEMVQQGDPRCP